MHDLPAGHVEYCPQSWRFCRTNTCRHCCSHTWMEREFRVFPRYFCLAAEMLFPRKVGLVGSGNHRPLCRVTDHVDIERLAWSERILPGGANYWWFICKPRFILLTSIISVTSSQPDHNGSEIEITSDTSVCNSSRRVYSCTHTGNLFSMKVENKSLLDNLFRNVLSNPFIWLGQYSSFC